MKEGNGAAPRGKSLGDWYWSMTKNQRLLAWIVSIALIPVYLVGCIGVVLLLYCQLGKERYAG